MYFDKNGKFISGNDIHKSQSLSSCDIMKTQNRICKGKCIQFKAKKPTNGSRYASGQVRCQLCEIYLTPEGVKDNRSCKCCNYRIRTKPRNSLYKEKFNEKVRNSHEPWISTDKNGDIKESTQENITPDIENEKKSTPIYEEIDESMKTYYEFKEFLEFKIKPQTNYPFVMFKELIEYGKLHKGEIAESLAYFNNKNTLDINSVKYYFDVPVYDVLLNHGFVIVHEGLLDIPYYSLNVKLEDFQKIELIDYLSSEIEKYNEEHNIPENQFPNANNMGNISWSSSNIKSTSNVQKIKNFVKKIQPKVEKTTAIIVKECPKCHDTKVEGFPGIEFDNKIEELFGYRQFDPSDPQTKKRQSYCRKCRSSQNIHSTSEQSDITEIESQNDKYVKIFDSEGDSLSIKNCKIERTDVIQKDQILTNNDIITKFSVRNMGGIRYTKNNDVIVLLSTYSDDYDDSIDLDSGLIIYTGEGKGEQELKKGNEKILNSKNTPMVFFKQVYQEPGTRKRGTLDNKYQFIGTVKYKKHYWETEKDRRVVKFVLEIQS